MEEKGKRKGRSRRNVAFVAGLLLVLLVGVSLYVVLPTGMPEGEAYFRPIGERELLPDEQGQWKYVRFLFGGLDASGDTFGGWNEDLQFAWRYSIAFSSYGLPSICLIDPKNADMTRYTMGLMVKMMKSKKIWKDWEEAGFGEDPISHQNIMYKGHLNLMYGLYQLMSGDDRFSREYAWLTGQIVREMREHHSQGLYEGANCQPDHYFVQCNSISLLSLHIYDKLYGTNYTENEVKWTLDFLRKRMTDPETGLYWMEYHPLQDTVERYLSGYTNAWSMVVLRPLDPDYHDGIYPVWKRIFVKEIGPYAYVREFPEGGPSEMATGFGLWAAKEFGDVELFTKLRNSVDKLGRLGWKSDSAMWVYKKGDNTLSNGSTLSFKVHVGWQTILNHDWTSERPADIPDVSGMTWKDVLPQEIHEFEHAPPAL